MINMKTQINFTQEVNDIKTKPYFLHIPGRITSHRPDKASLKTR